MKHPYLFLLVCLSYTCSLGQSALTEAFSPLVYTSWKAEGEWGNGSTFKQEVFFEYALDSTLVMVYSQGYTNPEQTEYGPRNTGIRKWDETSNSLVFWEYDAFGGVTTGTVDGKGKDIWYQYTYGDALLTESWEYRDDSTYAFTVGTYEGGVWTQTFLKTHFHKQAAHFPALASQLSGSWQAKAWDGVLHEQWEPVELGYMHANVYYVEKGDTLYAAETKIEQVGDDWVLISVIKDSSPKIFKAISYSPGHITFENSDYKNPSKVTYSFTEGSFQRTIEGMEQETPSVYTFNFQRN